jgi:putative transposase
MRKSFKYRIYPNKRQLHALDAVLEECRWLYNQTLEYRRNAWEQEQRTADWYETKTRIPKLKEERPSLKRVHSQVLQDVTKRVDLAYQHFFRRLKEPEVKSGKKKAGAPRFKGYGRYDSISFTQHESGYYLDRANKRLTLHKIGDVYIVYHRPIKGEVKTLTITRSSTGKWYACFSCDEVEPVRLPENPNRAGLDVGLKTFATLSDGEEIANPRFFREEEGELARVQRQYAKIPKPEKGQPSSLERKKKRLVVARVHERIKFKRDNFSHQNSRKIIDKHGFIAVEDLHVSRMLHNHKLAKSINDAAWNGFFGMLSSKAEEAGRVMVKVNPAYTSQTCSRCQYRRSGDEKLTLKDRIFVCPQCGLEMDRDLNAAKNILAVGLPGLTSVSLMLTLPLVGEEDGGGSSSMDDADTNNSNDT